MDAFGSGRLVRDVSTGPNGRIALLVDVTVIFGGLQVVRIHDDVIGSHAGGHPAENADAEIFLNLDVFLRVEKSHADRVRLHPGRDLFLGVGVGDVGEQLFELGGTMHQLEKLAQGRLPTQRTSKIRALFGRNGVQGALVHHHDVGKDGVETFFGKGMQTGACQELHAVLVESRAQRKRCLHGTCVGDILFRGHLSLFFVPFS
jgi:hypothetical protein